MPPRQERTRRSSQDDVLSLIDELLANNYSDQEIMDILMGIQSSQPDEESMTGGNISPADLARAEQEQQDFENLVSLIGLQGERAPYIPELSRSGVGYNPIDASSEIAASTAHWRNSMALSNDATMRQRNRDDYLWLLQNMPQQQPTDIMERVAQAKALYDVLRGRATSQPGQETQSPAVTEQAPPLVVEQAPAPAAERPQTTSSSQGGKNFLDDFRRNLGLGIPIKFPNPLTRFR
jgi:hypothetical protein